MTIIEVKKGLIELMKSVFPTSTYSYYSNAVVESYDRPSFFTQLKPISIEPSNYNSSEKVYAFYITYMQEVADEVDALNVIQKLENLFGLFVRVNDRAIKVQNFEYDFVGSEKTIPQIVVELEWKDVIPHVTEAPLMEDLETKYKLKTEV